VSAVGFAPRVVVAAVSGLLFAFGLALGGMTDPAKVRAFLDVFGAWDPSLAFVMGGAVGVYTLVFRFVRPRLSRPVLAPRFELPTRRDLDPRLILGAAVFGVGWGLGGICPGPAVVSFASGGLDILVFLAAMAAGMGIASLRKG
jgi:uncharacterized membrane protein YedE/YeeE